MISDKELYKLLAGCRKGNRKSQEKLYEHYFGYGMSISLRYSKTRGEAVEVLNDAFIKIFNKLDKYSKGLSFKGWLRRIIINTAIDHFRKNEKHYHSVDISYAKTQEVSQTVIQKIAADEILEAVRELPPSYRLVFNLHVIEGFKHEEIAQKLDISVGTSKSNLAVARSKLKRVLINNGTERKESHG